MQQEQEDNCVPLRCGIGGSEVVEDLSQVALPENTECPGPGLCWQPAVTVSAVLAVGEQESSVPSTTLRSC